MRKEEIDRRIDSMVKGYASRAKPDVMVGHMNGPAKIMQEPDGTICFLPYSISLPAFRELQKEEDFDGVVFYQDSRVQSNKWHPQATFRHGKDPGKDFRGIRGKDNYQLSDYSSEHLRRKFSLTPVQIKLVEKNRFLTFSSDGCFRTYHFKPFVSKYSAGSRAPVDKQTHVHKQNMFYDYYLNLDNPIPNKGYLGEFGREVRLDELV